VNRKLIVFIGITLFFSNCTNNTGEEQWYKGNLHTHTFWSDGDAPPEIAVAWYKDRDYDFLALSDHNILSVGEKWIKVLEEDTSGWPPSMTKAKLANVRERFGADWPITRMVEDTLEMALATLPKLKKRFEEPGKFLMIQAEEITDRYDGKPIHVNATNLLELIPPQGGNSTHDVLQRNINAVNKQRKETGQGMLAHVNHPNFGWGVVAENLIELRGDTFFEVYNGHPGVRNWGDDAHPGTDRMWDIVLAMRLHHGLEPLFGLAVDDTHVYYKHKIGKSNPGRGWVMVKAQALNTENIIASLEKGNFYSTTGVILEDIQINDRTLTIHIREKTGVSYRTQFIGTLKQFDTSSEPVLNSQGEPAHITRVYSNEIGQVFSETTDNPAVFSFTGTEMYVRSKIISDQLQDNPFAEGDLETAWTQPVLIK
jgi:hypothetical protein